MNEEIFSRLASLIARELGVDESEIRLDSHLQEDLNADPLSIADFIVALEAEFAIKIPQEAAVNFVTVGDILNFISDQTSEI